MFQVGDEALWHSMRKVVVRGPHVEGTYLVQQGDDEPVSVREDTLRPAHPSCFPWTDDIAHREKQRRLRRRIETRRVAGPTEEQQAARAAHVQLAEMLGGVTSFDLRGHWKGETNLNRLYTIFRPELVAALLRPPLDLSSWASVPMDHTACPYCGRNPRIETNGKAFRLQGPRCPYPDGFTTTEIELNVPSGFLVIAEDLTGWFPTALEYDDTYAGRRANIEAFGKVGLARGNLGTCAEVYADPLAGRLVVVRPGKAPTARADRVGFPLEGLWAMCDQEEAHRRFERFPDRALPPFCMVRVRPGVYRVQQPLQPTGDVFAELEWIRLPDPIQDFIADYDGQQLTAGQYVRQEAARRPVLCGARDEDGYPKSWEDMTPEEQDRSWYETGRMLIYRLGLVADPTDLPRSWHENGFPLTAIEDGPDAYLRSSTFRRQYPWIRDGLREGLIHLSSWPIWLNPSFRYLIFSMLKSMISFGVRPYADIGAGGIVRDVAAARKTMHAALEAYRHLAMRFPQYVDKDYAEWATDTRADRWVERFELGPAFIPEGDEPCTSPSP